MNSGLTRVWMPCDIVSKKCRVWKVITSVSNNCIVYFNSALCAQCCQSRVETRWIVLHTCTLRFKPKRWSVCSPKVEKTIVTFVHLTSLLCPNEYVRCWRKCHSVFFFGPPFPICGRCVSFLRWHWHPYMYCTLTPTDTYTYATLRSTSTEPTYFKIDETTTCILLLIDAANH